MQGLAKLVGARAIFAYTFSSILYNMVAPNMSSMEQSGTLTYFKSRIKLKFRYDVFENMVTNVNKVKPIVSIHNVLTIN